MYKVLLVDDERMILEGISSIVDWEKQGTILAGTARNGIEGLDFIRRNRPDIVVSDITMPGLDGMELIEKSSHDYPAIKWILLSGYNEFEYAQKAMRFGVKHYLLKPCDEAAISEALNELVNELNDQQKESIYLKNIENRANITVEGTKEMLFKEVLTNSTLQEDQRNDFYEKQIGLPADQISARLILFHLENSDLSILPLAKKMAVNHFGQKAVMAWTILGEDLLLLLSEDFDGQEELLSFIKKVQDSFGDRYQSMLTVVISGSVEAMKIHSYYQRVAKSLEERFYKGKGSIIFESKSAMDAGNDSELYENDMERIIFQLKAGRQGEARQELSKTIEKIKAMKLKPTIAKSYLIQLYISIIKVTSPSIGEEHTREISKLEGLETLSSFHAILEKALVKGNSLEAATQQLRYSAVVARMIDVIHDNLENPDLSLQWMAKKALYMNTDYLGKTFKKEVGKKFSAYVMNRRIDKAIEIIEQEGDVKVFELAERLGFGNNPQYFSQIFKKRTGCTPTDLIRSN
ncbi:response regulator transcription factor [Sediminibacillus albus]|uniref:Two-component system, response regulator YesN n=1 Tax=Sediminibacillus albus TaxID=407036 RepID=A0A1G8YF99_9BACI|nr:response regulator [Sediminibacillus albus]SDK01084.1 two-component system, response regulator YesN [Sediminibacillus albus]